MSLKKLFLETLVFSRTEKRGIVFMLLIIAGLSVALYILNFKTIPWQNDFTQFNSDIERFELMLKKDSAKKFHNYSKPDYAKDAQKVTIFFSPFVFDPNTVADSLWTRFGLTEKQANVIVNYKSKGGKFYSKNDVKKMYCISDSIYSLMEPYIVIEQTVEHNKKIHDSLVTEKPNPVFDLVIDINTSAAEDFEKLPGIGAARSKLIVGYRNQLGGFADKSQVREVYGLNDSIYAAIEKYLVKTGNPWLQVNINTDIAQEIKHPYIKYSTAKIISAYHKVHGDFSSIEELKKLSLLDDELYRKLAPYLKAEKSK